MSQNAFEQQCDKSYRKQTIHRRIDVALRLITLGLVDNAKRWKKYTKEHEQDLENLKQYNELLSDAKRMALDNDTIEIYGVRVSKHCFTDLPVARALTYGVNWDNLRDDVLSRDGYECQESDGRCNGPLQVHHKLPLSKGGSNDVNNLVTLCFYHHSLKHPHMRT